ncbi:dephospho-CoA kinase [Pedobacter sp. UYP24]
MLKIGITGGIGSGKTTISRIFETLGIPVFFADTVAKSIMVSDDVLINDVKIAFGELSYFKDGGLNNKHIAAIVFNDAEQLNRLNSLVHPAVFRAFDAWVANLPKSVPYILKEAALLFESGSYKMSDKNILVISQQEVRLNRVMVRDNVSADQVQARMAKQFSDEKKLAMADYLINNDESVSLITQTMALHQQFLNLKI